ncbi:Uncaracterized surface protein containing fasciclin (FAS1) repeats [Kushneria avicenniae]|uniref:Uncaracterized surface protein containing fasciclin (FAS1) repeats n=1 Tax=Kushneria avicenniae TaxID=402385 RepID=A0A1I1I5I3_9GAMM|nr:fasciclin domain-containing protein [Kushneria avicenniae]SFC31341.1 Uncaracterized surface protein containing fasciclin (FAS1) repeats [Kushneria avicenniae]
MKTLYRSMWMAASLALVGGGMASMAQAQSPSQQAPQQQPGDITEHESQTLLETLRNSGDFNTLVQAIDKAGMSDMLDGHGPYTMFAPTDEAFAQLPAKERQALLGGDHNEWLRKVLKYHLLPGIVPASEFETLGRPQALAGQLSLRVDNGHYRVNDVPVEREEIRAHNGIVHPIDGVLMPWDATGLRPDA